MNNTYNAYDDFAYFYNKYWTGYPQKIMFNAVKQLLPKTANKKLNILDVCCGTGNIAGFLYSKGHMVKGIDGSQVMLDYAKTNVPEASFTCLDARDFLFNQEFDVITCLFDSVNHLTNEEDVQKLFRNTYNSLKKNGIFIFDANSLESCLNVSNSGFSRVEEKEAFILTASFNPSSQTSVFQMTVFVLEKGSWIRQDITIYEKYYSPEFLIKNLKEVGFKNIILVDDVKGFKGERFFFCGEKL